MTFDRKAYMREYWKRPEVKIKEKERAKKRKEYLKRYMKTYYKTPKHKLKKKARNIATYWLKDLQSPGTEMHHPDYSQPLLVEVLPIKEHKALHIQLNRMKEVALTS